VGKKTDYIFAPA